MAREIELKFRVPGFEAVRARLTGLGGRAGGRVLEVNHILDTPDRRLLAGDCGLRVRTWRSLDPPFESGATVAFKGPRAAGGVKSREELETAVSDAASVIEIARRLGFVEVVRYEKRREKWVYRECEVALDELPELGEFVEIEAADAATACRLAEELGLSVQAAEEQTYVHLAAAHGRLRDDGCRCLEFRSRHGPAE